MNGTAYTGILGIRCEVEKENISYAKTGQKHTHYKLDMKRDIRYVKNVQNIIRKQSKKVHNINWR